MDALGTYVSFMGRDGSFQGIDVQNFHVQEQRTYEGRTYLYGNFGYTGANVDLQAANIEASLVFAVTDLMLAIAQEAADAEWLVQIKTVWLDPETLEETSDQLLEIFSVTSWQHNQREVVLRLASPLDAQASEIPARVLSRRMVGNLPSTGNIAFV